MTAIQKNSEIVGLVRKAKMASILDISIRTLEVWMTKGFIPYQKVDKLVSFNPIEVKKAIEDRFTVHPK